MKAYLPNDRLVLYRRDKYPSILEFLHLPRGQSGLFAAYSLRLEPRTVCCNDDKLLLSAHPIMNWLAMRTQFDLFTSIVVVQFQMWRRLLFVA